MSILNPYRKQAVGQEYPSQRTRRDTLSYDDTEDAGQANTSMRRKRESDMVTSTRERIGDASRDAYRSVHLGSETDELMLQRGTPTTLDNIRIHLGRQLTRREHDVLSNRTRPRGAQSDLDSDHSEQIFKTKPSRIEIEKATTVQVRDDFGTWTRPAKDSPPQAQKSRPGYVCDDWTNTPWDSHAARHMLESSSCWTPGTATPHDRNSVEVSLDVLNLRSLDGEDLKQRLSEDFPDDAFPNNTSVFASDVEEERTTESLTTPPSVDKAHLDTAHFLEDAWETLGLQKYTCVDEETLKRHVDLPICWTKSHSEVAHAYATIVKHLENTDGWALRLRWNDDLDAELLKHVTKGKLQKHSKLGSDLGTTVEDCTRRWEEIKPKDTESARPRSAVTTTTNKNGETSYSVWWSSELDEKLMVLKNACPTPSWSSIADELGVNAKHCKRRFKQIAPKGWSRTAKEQSSKAAKAKKLARKNTSGDAPTSTPAVGSTEKVSASIGCSGSDVWDDPSCRSHGISWPNTDKNKEIRDCGCEVGTWCLCGTVPTAAEAPRASPDSFDQQVPCERHNCSFRYCGCQSTPVEDLGDVWGVARSGHDTSVCGQCDDRGSWVCTCSDTVAADGWATVDARSQDNAMDQRCRSCYAAKTAPFDPEWCGDPDFHHISQSLAQAAAASSFAVTYWATIESGGDKINIPVKSNNVSGPMKSIANSGMQKVWKWVHDKGLGGKVGLQDAFDLAQSMQMGDDAKEPDSKEFPCKSQFKMSARSVRPDTGFGGWV